jgi:ribonuclease PH
MDKLIEYSKLIKRILTEYVELCRHPQQDIETFLITDEQNGH